MDWRSSYGPRNPLCLFPPTRRMKTVFILGLTSDIGRELAQRFHRNGWSIVGTHRPNADLSELPPDTRLHTCDLADPAAAALLGKICHAASLRWNLLVVAAGTEEPIGEFWSCKADEWDTGIAVNALAPLRVVRDLYPLRVANERPAVAFFSGAGTNSSAPAYSAYCAAKIFLMKMCELLDAESLDTSFFIIGPGIVRTKIHEQTLRTPEHSGANYRKVVEFLASNHPGTSHDDIYACLLWCLEAGKSVVGGRNFSVVHDAWRNGGGPLSSHLKKNPDLYKLRRFGNELKFPAII